MHHNPLAYSAPYISERRFSVFGALGNWVICLLRTQERSSSQSIFLPTRVFKDSYLTCTQTTFPDESRNVSVLNAVDKIKARSQSRRVNGD